MFQFEINEIEHTNFVNFTFLNSVCGYLFFCHELKRITMTSDISKTHPFSKIWQYTLDPEDKIYSFPNVIAISGLVFHLEQVHLTIIEAQEQDAPVPVYSTAAKRIPGCSLQIGLTDIVGLRRKFVIGVLSSVEPQKSLDLYFDSDQLKTLSIGIVGRPHLDANRCEIQLIGTFYFNVPFGPELSQAIKENGFEELNENLKVVRLMKQIKNVDTSSSSDDENENKEEEDKMETDSIEENQNKSSEIQQIGPKSFLNKGVSIFELVKGHGRTAQIGDRVKIVYKGKLDPTKSKTFDKATIVKPFEFTLGSKKVIQGINYGVEGMCVESIRELIIPSHLGFGQMGLGERVPPNATLYYDLTLKEITPKNNWKKIQQKNNKETQEKKYKKQKETTKLLHVRNRVKI